MYDIKRYNFTKSDLENVKNYRFGNNWPIVYILENGKEAYIGEAGSAYRRAQQHLQNPERLKLHNFYIIADDEYNKSATLDIESSLIKYMSGDGKYLLQNGNGGIQESDYYDRERYQAKFEVVWSELRKRKIASKDLNQIENSDLFKYSPYKSLSPDQLSVVESMLSSIRNNEYNSFLVSGEPGTGKTIVASYLMKLLSTKEWSKDLKIGLVIPMTSLRKTLKRVFKTVKGLDSRMVIGPYDVVKDKYDLLIVDEAHRLQRRVNLTNFPAYDEVNSKLGLKDGTQLDWIMKSSESQILFYDEFQSVRPGDIRPEELEKYKYQKYKLVSQMRVKGGQDYIKYIKDILNVEQKEKVYFPNYDFKLFDSIKEMKEAIEEKDKDKNYGLSRLLAGYAWEWKTNKDEYIDYDIEIEGVKLRWNSVTEDWVNSPNAINEVGCIHTIQGYDLNYAGVIIGPEMSYDENKNEIVVDRDKYLDFNGRRAISDLKELEIYIKNIYKTLLTRGIYGTYVYVVDKNLREYLRRFIY